MASLITAINVMVAGGFSIAAARHASTEASLIFALYAAARAIPICLAALIAIYRRAGPALLALGTLAGVIQLLDAGIGFIQHDPGKSFGPLIIAAFQFLAMLNLSRSMRGQAVPSG